MFCNKCGKEVRENQMFCDACGNKINLMTNTANNRTTVMFKAQQVGHELCNIVGPLQKVEEYYNKGIKIQKRLNDAIKNKNADFMGLKLGISAFAALFVGGYIGLYIAGFIYYISNYTVSPLILLPIIFVCMIVIGVVAYFLLHKMLKKKMEKRHEKLVDSLQMDFNNNQLLYFDVLETVLPVLKKYIPEDYWYSQAVASIGGYFRNGRAGTMKEALNLYEEEMHRLRMENMQEQTLRLNQKQTTYAAISAWNTSMTAMGIFLK